MIETKRRVTAADLLNPEFHRKCEEEIKRKVYGPSFGNLHKTVKNGDERELSKIETP